MRRMSIPMLVLVVAAGFGSANAQTQNLTQSQNQQRGTLETTVTGTIVHVDAKSLVLRTDTAEERRYTLNSQTTKPADLKEGSRVQVTSNAPTSGKQAGTLMATRITMALGTTSGSLTGDKSWGTGSTGSTGSASSGSAGMRLGTTDTRNPSGTIVSMDNQTLVLRTDQGERRYMIRSEFHAPQNLQPGSRVRVVLDDQMMVSGISPFTGDDISRSGMGETGTQNDRDWMGTGSTAGAQNDRMGTSLSDSRYPSQPTERVGLGQTKTVSGTVVSIDDQKLVLRTDAGKRHEFVLSSLALPLQNLQEGNKVQVTYKEDGYEMAATRIQSLDTTSARVDADRYGRSDSLPRTASPLASYGLAGLLALAGALAVRFFIKVR